MDNETIKQKLLEIQPTELDFQVILTGKESTRVNGLYNPGTREILLHNKNFKEDNQLIYTAIHEYAHHLQSCENSLNTVPGSRCHSRSFWALFHTLLDEAEAKGVYRPLYRTDPELTAAAKLLKEKYLTTNAAFMLEFGRELNRVRQLCLEKGVRFEDFVDRCLGLPRTEANAMITVSSSSNPDPSLGWENLKTLTRIRDEEMLSEAQEAFREGKSSDFVKELFLPKAGKKVGDEKEALLAEKNRLERTIANLEKRLEEVVARLER